MCAEYHQKVRSMGSWHLLSLILYSSTLVNAVNLGGTSPGGASPGGTSPGSARGGDSRAARHDATFKVCVVGAGPCSLLFSNALLRKNPRAVVEIFELSPQGGSLDDGSSGFGLGICARNALDEVPALLSEVERVGTYVYMRQSRPGEAPLRIKTGLLRLSRKKLTSVMLRSLKAEHGSRVRATFGAQCGEIDFGGRTVDVRLRRGGTRRVAYDLLVGADGVNSQVRQQLAARGDVRVEHYVSPRVQNTAQKRECLLARLFSAKDKAQARSRLRSASAKRASQL